MEHNFHLYSPQFFTPTIHEWQHLLAEDKRKDIILKSLSFLVAHKKIELNAFVIMSNHIHLIWQPLFDFTLSDIKASFMKYTAQQLKRSLTKDALAAFKVNKYDRDFQFWKREALSIELISAPVFYQKLEYIHYNPVTAGLCVKPEDYYYSSARFYFDGKNDFGMLTHFRGN